MARKVDSDSVPDDSDAVAVLRANRPSDVHCDCLQVLCLKPFETAVEEAAQT